MTMKMLIDATHPEETRVAIVNGAKLEEFDFESASKKQLKGNVYLAKVTRVEPSLQAAFIDYGGNRHGFLSFNEIHPDYYQIPVSDREKLIEAEQEDESTSEPDENAAVEVVGGDEIEEEAERRRPRSFRRYKVQEVIKRRQIMLVQVVKEERGNKGAALTTYLSLAGRYCVLMPNTARGGGISRKIANPKDRKRLKTIVDSLDIPEGMAVIVRTAGADRSKPEIKRDYEYLMRQWDDIRTLTLESTAPCRINEEGNLIKRSIRDLYSKDIEQILVEGEAGYRLAKDFMKSLIPSHAVRVKQYKDETVPVLHRYKVESQIDAIHNPIVQLRSGGYLVISPTEALVAIDVNSGRSTRERNIEETAFKTNMETAEEVARQLRLRDLAGLIVIDFIDMENSRNIHAVERKLKDSLKGDRARIQVGRISPFGLLEMSRQRLRPSVIESSSDVCPVCGGVGHVRSTESAALHAIRMLEEEGVRQPSGTITLQVPTKVALYILNQKRAALNVIETRYDFTVAIEVDDSLVPPDFRLNRVRQQGDVVSAEPPKQAPAARDSATSEEAPRKRRSRRRRPRQRDDQNEQSANATESPNTNVDAEGVTEDTNVTSAPTSSDNEEAPKKRSRRGRRGGRRRGRQSQDTANTTENAVDNSAENVSENKAEDTAGTPSAETSSPETSSVENAVTPETAPPTEATAESSTDTNPVNTETAAPETTTDRDEALEKAAPEATTAEAEAPKTDGDAKTETSEEATAEQESAPKVKRPRRRTRTRKTPEKATADAEATVNAESSAADKPVEANANDEATSDASKSPAPKRPRRRRRTKAAPETASPKDPITETVKEPTAKDDTSTPPSEAASEPAPVTAPTEGESDTATAATSAQTAIVESAPITTTVNDDEAPNKEPKVVEAASEPTEPPKPKRGGWWQRVLG